MDGQLQEDHALKFVFESLAFFQVQCTRWETMGFQTPALRPQIMATEYSVTMVIRIVRTLYNLFIASYEAAFREGPSAILAWG